MTFVPGQRLIGLVAGLAILAAVTGPLGGWGAGYALSLSVLALVALGDLLAGLRHDALPVPAVPALLRFAKDRPGTIPLTLSARVPLSGPVRVGLGAPAALGVRQSEMAVTISFDGKLRTEWACQPNRRGRFGGATACVEASSPWGLWRLRRHTALAVEFRVYPNLLAEGREAAALFLPRYTAGIHAERTVGRGREFEKLREYLPGDSLDVIHWKASAKRSRPVTKVFQAERTQEIYAIVDASRLSARRVGAKSSRGAALERSLTAALALLTAAERQGDRFGFGAFGEGMRAFVPAGSGQGHFSACREAALTLESSNAAPEIAEIVRFLRTRLRRRSLLFFILDLTDPVLADDFLTHATMLARQHLVIVGQLRAPEVAPVFSGPPVASEDELYGRLAGHVRWTELRAIMSRLRPTGVMVALLENDTMAADMIRRYLAVKRRQAL